MSGKVKVTGLGSGANEPKNGVSKPENGVNEQKVIDWVQIKAEYISGTMSASKLAEKHGVSVYAIRKRSGKERWQELRKQNQNKTASKIAEKINTEKVKKTVREIDRVVSVASKLITKLNRAVNELDKDEELIKKKVTVKADKSEDEKTATAEEEYSYDYAKRKTLVNTKRAAEISKSLLNVRDILADYTTEQDEESALGIIEIPMQEVMQPPESEEQDGENVE